MSCRALDVGDRLSLSESSSLGRSLSRVIRIADELVKQEIRFVAIQEAIRCKGEQDLAIRAVP